MIAETFISYKRHGLLLLGCKHPIHIIILEAKFVQFILSGVNLENYLFFFFLNTIDVKRSGTKCAKLLNRPVTLLFLNGVFFFFFDRFPGQCEFPATWSGRWFQSGVNHYININSTSITTKGVCVKNVSDKFLIEDRYNYFTILLLLLSSRLLLNRVVSAAFRNCASRGIK